MKRRMEVAGLAMDPVTRSPVMILRDPETQAGVPIWIGPFEADSIRMILDAQPGPRPVTHDLFADALRRLNARIVRVEITALKENTYFAAVFVEAGGREVELDSRPSDAVALAVRFDAPVYMSQQVFEAARIPMGDIEEEDEGDGEDAPAPEAQSAPAGSSGSQPATPEPEEQAVRFDDSNKDKWTELLEKLKPEHLSKYKM